MAAVPTIPRYTVTYPEEVIEAPDGIWMRAADVEAVFQRGVAYMPVPRCDSCKWWTLNEPLPRTTDRWGLCLRNIGNETSNENYARFYCDSSLDVIENFGCVQHEPTEPTA